MYGTNVYIHTGTYKSYKPVNNDDFLVPSLEASSERYSDQDVDDK